MPLRYSEPRMSTVLPPWLRPHPDGTTLDVLVQPRAGRTRIVGEHDGRLKIQLAAPPVDGEANSALLSFLAARLDLPRRDLDLLTGLTGRRKTVRLGLMFGASGFTSDALDQELRFASDEMTIAFVTPEELQEWIAAGAESDDYIETLVRRAMLR